MSPLISPPSRGYQDYQRIGNWDSGVLWNQTPVLSNAAISSPVIDVSRYGYLGGFLRELSTACSVNLGFFTDAAGTNAIGGRQFVLDANVFEPARMRIPSQGPFVQFTVVNIGGVNYQFQAVVLGTNRVHPCEFIPRFPTLINQQVQAIGATSTVTVYPSTYFAGPIQVHSLCRSGNWQWVLRMEDTAGTWDQLYVTPGLASTAYDERVVVAPPGAWRIDVINAAATASTFDLAVTPAITGAT